LSPGSSEAIGGVTRATPQHPPLPYDNIAATTDSSSGGFRQHGVAKSTLLRHDIKLFKKGSTLLFLGYICFRPSLQSYIA